MLKKYSQTFGTFNQIRERIGRCFSSFDPRPRNNLKQMTQTVNSNFDSVFFPRTIDFADEKSFYFNRQKILHAREKSKINLSPKTLMNLKEC